MITLIWAQGLQGEIGFKNTIPWHLPNDLKFFKETTRGKTIVMGRKTYESIGKPLPHRKNIVLTSKEGSEEGVYYKHNIEAILSLAKTEDVFIIGGSTLYEQFMEFADAVWITEVFGYFEADTYAPNLDPNKWVNEMLFPGIYDGKNLYKHRFLKYVRKNTETKAGIISLPFFFTIFTNVL